MKILLTGATGYIGKRLLPVLIKNGHHVVCCTRDIERFNPPENLKGNISWVWVLPRNEVAISFPSILDEEPVI